MITNRLEQCALFLLLLLLLFSPVAVESQTNDSAGRSYVVVEKKGAHAGGGGHGGGAGVQLARGHSESLSKGEGGDNRRSAACRHTAVIFASFSLPRLFSSRIRSSKTSVMLSNYRPKRRAMEEKYFHF
ncbi:uncharacterized protein LOC141823788 [Curcuma longa]|uniref:uncharacterized protein LOC141823788 n=1 Tax=Curcuma longa TaxID=136217 RepID=UPI003D9E58A5